MNKYRNKRTEYNNITYDSKKEANYAIQLDWQIKAKEVVKWERQIRYKLIVEGINIGTYVLDFKVYYTDGSIRYIDVKGLKKGAAYSIFTIKKKLMLALHKINVEEV